MNTKPKDHTKAIDTIKKTISDLQKNVKLVTKTQDKAAKEKDEKVSPEDHKAALDHFASQYKMAKMNKDEEGAKEHAKAYNDYAAKLNSHYHSKLKESLSEGGPFSYGAKKPRRGSVADMAAKKRREQDKQYKPTEPKDQMVGVAKVTKGVAEAFPYDVDHMPGKLGSRPVSGQLGDSGKKDTYVKTFHARKEKEAHEFAKSKGYVVKKHMYPAGHKNEFPHEFQVHKEEVEMVDGRARVYHTSKGVVTPSQVQKAKQSLPQKDGKKWSFDTHGHDGKRPYMDFVHVKEETNPYLREENQLDELKSSTLTSYASKAREQVKKLSKQGEAAMGRGSFKTAHAKYVKATKRALGASSAEAKALNK